MEMPSTLVISIIAEVLFLVAVALSVGLAYQHKKCKRLQQKTDTLEHIIDDLRANIVKTHLSMSDKSDDIDQSSQRYQEELDQAQKLLITYKQRLENLERFRSLYFELDGRLSDEVDDAQDRENKIEELKLLIERQEHVIRELKSNIRKITEDYKLSEETCHDLERMLDELGTNSKKLHEQLDMAEFANFRAEKLEKELDHYKIRVDQLEETERKLSIKSEQYRKQIDEQQEYGKKKNPYGKVRVSEIESMSKELSKKEKEIHHLREECDTIAKQYEMLAITSMKSIEEIQKTSQEEKVNLQQMQFILEQAAKSLEEKAAECEELENLYLQLKYPNSEEAESLLDESIAACNDLKSTIVGVVNKAGMLSGNKENKPLSHVRQRLEEKERVLTEKRAQFRHLKNDYKNKLKQDSTVDSSTEALQLENRNLRVQLDRTKLLKEDIKSKDVEISTLKSELSLMESRYLKLLEKQRR